MYYVVASDLDGTLLSPDHVLTPYTKKILNLLTDKGIHFIFATGRHHIDVGQIRDGLGINAYMIASNGARVHNTRENWYSAIIWHRKLPVIYVCWSLIIRMF